ncbi:MAG: DsrE family protein [Burkholderiaceae bacterium]
MNRRLFTQSLAIGAIAFAVPAAFAQQAPAKRNRIVVQMSDADPQKWNLALNNIRNLQEDVGASNVDIELVAYGPGIGMLKMDAPVAQRVADAAKAGVKVLACENTMRGQKLTKDDMNAAVGYVPAGVTEIMRKQGEGWAYLRP